MSLGSYDDDRGATMSVSNYDDDRGATMSLSESSSVFEIDKGAGARRDPTHRFGYARRARTARENAFIKVSWRRTGKAGRAGIWCNGPSRKTMTSDGFLPVFWPNKRSCGLNKLATAWASRGFRLHRVRPTMQWCKQI